MTSPRVLPTTSPSGVLIGSQTPRICNVPAYHKTYGGEVTDFMAQIGRPLDPWQALCVDVAFAVQPDGLWAAFEFLLALARQNGKGGVTEAIELAGVFLFKEELVLHSAHQFKTSTAAFRRLQNIIDGSDWLRRRVKMISRSKGDESIELTRAAGGGRIQFVARTLGSGRGLTGSTTVFDEAAWLTIAQYAAQTPTLATIPNPRIVYTSTPPDEEVGPMPEDAMLPSVRKRGLARGERIAMLEWSPPKKFDRTDPAVHAACNPARGIRISAEFLHRQLVNFTAAGKPEKFDTEHLGVWPDDEDEQWLVISENDWTDALDELSRATGPIAIGIDMSTDRSKTAIAIVGARDDGLLHGQLVEYGAGTTWVVDWVTQAIRERKPCAVVVGRNGPAKSIIPDLEAAKIEVITPGTEDVAGACGALYDAIAGANVEDRVLRQSGQEPLKAAVAAARKKKTGGAWIWDHAAGEPSPLYALTAAKLGHALRAHLVQSRVPLFARA